MSDEDDDDEVMNNKHNEDEDPEFVLNKPPRAREYPPGHKGPYVVFIKEKESPLSHISISQRVNEKFRGKVKSLVKVHKSKIRVELIDGATASEVLKANFLGGYRVYIPAETVEIDGIINLEEDCNLIDLVKNGFGKFSNPGVPMVKVTHAYRFRKLKSKSTSNPEAGENEQEYENTSAVRVSFQGTALPRWLTIHNLLIPVRMYIPKLMSCKTCMGDHHTSKHCTSLKKCLKCKDNHSTIECPQKTPWCPHCKKELTHEAKEDCPAFFARTQKLKNKTKQLSKKSYADALRQVVPTANSFEVLQNPLEGYSNDFVQVQNVIPLQKRRKTLETSSHLKKNGGKRPRSEKSSSESEEEIWNSMKPRPSQNKPQSTDSKPKQKKRTNSKRNNTENVTNMFDKAIKDFLVSLCIPEPFNSLLIAFVMPLVKNWMSKLSKFLSTFFGNVSSFGAISSTSPQ
jgi:hypothetical protein